jgi:RNA polymerase sigma-70 factor, ECF subfamily
MTTRHPLAHLADEDLMQIGSEDAARAFEVIYDRHSRPAYSLAYRILGSQTTAEEAVQEAFLSVWRSRSRYLPERGSLRSWILAIAHSRSIDVLRRNAVHLQRRAFSADDDFEDRREASERTDDEVIEREQAGELREALTQLAPSQQKVVELAYFGGFTHREISEMLKEPLGTIKGRMRLGLEKLRENSLGEVA